MARNVEDVDNEVMIIANGLASVGYRAMTIGRKIIVQRIDMEQTETPLVMEITGFGWPQSDGTWWESDNADGTPIEM